MVFIVEFFDVHHHDILWVEFETHSHKTSKQIVVKPDFAPSGVAKSVLTFFPVKHTSALNRVIVEITPHRDPRHGPV
jgi:hypothetical protein